MDPTDILSNAASGTGKITAGIDQIFLYNNIAITTLTVMCLLLAAGNLIQYWTGNKRQDKDFQRFVDVTKAMSGIEGAIDELKSIFSFVMQLYKQNTPPNTGGQNADPDKKG